MSNLILPSHLDGGLPIIEAPAVLFAGHYEIYKGKCDRRGRRIPGTRCKVADFENLITDFGLEQIGGTVNDYQYYCHVGTGTVAEAVGDTALGTFVAAKQVYNPGYPGRAATASLPYYGTSTYYYPFGAGAAAGVLSEIGISDQVGTGNLFSRSLIKDGGGSPTTITVLGDEYLDVYYKLRMYPDHTTSDGTGTITITGVGSVGYTIRAALVTNSAYTRAGYVAGGYGNSYEIAKVYAGSAALGTVDSDIAATYSNGISSGGDSGFVNSAYVASSLYKDVTYTIGIGSGNITGGIDAIRVNTTLGAYQILFDTNIPKTSAKIFTFVLRTAWARKTL